MKLSEQQGMKCSRNSGSSTGLQMMRSHGAVGVTSLGARVTVMASGCVFALSAGFLGAAASLSAKLSIGADHLRDMCESGLSGRAPEEASALCDWVRERTTTSCLDQKRQSSA